MQIKDITYCNRECANYKCRMNPEVINTMNCNYAYYGAFKNCEEFIPKNKNRIKIN